jgi:tellurite resistance protein TerC
MLLGIALPASSTGFFTVSPAVCEWGLIRCIGHFPSRTGVIMSNTKSLLWSLFWLSGALGFTGMLYHEQGTQPAITFLSCYFVEQILSVDNLFMFYVIFKYFKVELPDQRKLLNVGLITSYLLRALIIIPGMWLVNHYHWLTYLFGLFLFVSAISMFRDLGDGDEESYVAWFVKRLPNWSRMWVILATIELTDVVFAFDSIPAGFGLTNNAMILLAANVFAIGGLRCMYFLLHNALKRFVCLETSVGFILLTISVRVLVQDYVPITDSVLFGLILVYLLAGIGGSILDEKLSGAGPNDVI